MRICTKCDTEKPLEDFYRKKGALHGRDSRCKECQRLHKKKGRVRDRLLIYKYGITEEQFNVMNDEQQGLCKSCGQPETRKNTKNLAVDHNHKTGEVRGLLCQRCNTALGLLDEDPKRIEALLGYINSFL